MDLVWRNNRWVAQPNFSCDTEMKHGNNFIESRIALPLLKNAYRVLCTRGIHGCFVFCVDSETAEYLRNALGSV